MFAQFPPTHIASPAKFSRVPSPSGGICARMASKWASDSTGAPTRWSKLLRT